MINIIKNVLMVENRVGDIKKDLLKDFSDLLIPQSYKTGKKYPEWFEFMLENDPSGSQKYLSWIIKILRKNHGSNKLHPFTVSEKLVIDIVDSVILFHNNLDKISKERVESVIKKNKKEFSVIGGGSLKYLYTYPLKDLESILNSPKDINSYNDHILLFTLINSIGKLPTKKDAKKEIDKIYEDEYWLVIKPKTHRASCLYGATTKWCTSAKEDPSTFDVYQSKTSMVFYVIGKNLTDKHDLNKIAINITDKFLRFFDSIDTEYNLIEILRYVDMFLGPNYSNSLEKIINVCREEFSSYRN
jgi:hypothetical protein